MLTAAEARGIRVARASVNHDTYKSLAQMCSEKIKAASGMNATRVTWQVPPFVTGRPIYKLTHAVRYVTEKLQRRGFKVSHLTPTGLLLVDWAKEKKRKGRKTKPPKKHKPPPHVQHVPMSVPMQQHSGGGKTLSQKLADLKRGLQ